MTTRHLDLGCGAQPRNPYSAEEVYGTEQFQGFEAQKIFRCRLGLEPLPFERDFFDSVSAFDLLEHIPRQSVRYDINEITYPFISLMNEIFRVLRPGGVFMALTPAFPSKQAFQDPTHVNFITDSTHLYFCDSGRNSLRYGFSGNFSPVRIDWVLPEEIYQNKKSLKFYFKAFRYRFLKRSLTHLYWELKAVK